MVQLAVYPSGTAQGTYYIEITKDGLISCAIGQKNSNTLSDNSFLINIVSVQEAVISNDDINKLTELAAKLPSDTGEIEKEFYLGGWNVLLCYNNKEYETEYRYGENEAFRQLIDEIVGLSPTTVRLYSFS